MFKQEFDKLATTVHQNAIDKGWWEGDKNNGEMIALIHCELSEAVEALRCGNPLDSHIPDYTGVEAELADVIIRIMDLAKARGWDVGGAVEEKIEYNKNRSYKHGGKLF